MSLDSLVGATARTVRCHLKWSRSKRDGSGEGDAVTAGTVFVHARISCACLVHVPTDAALLTRRSDKWHTSASSRSGQERLPRVSRGIIFAPDHRVHHSYLTHLLPSHSTHASTRAPSLGVSLPGLIVCRYPFEKRT